MARFEITSELINMLKTMRVSNGFRSKDVAERINKSPSYYTRLEKGEIKTIDEKELTSILQFIYKKETCDMGAFDDLLRSVYTSLELRFTQEEIKNQLWFHNYDTINRIIPIPPELVDDINARIKHAGISVAYLCERINANEDIDQNITNLNKYPFNQWQAFVENHKVIFYFIRIKLDELEVEKILKKEKTGTNYTTMYAITHYLIKIEEYESRVHLNEEEEKGLNLSAKDYLNRFKFYSIVERSKLIQSSKNEVELNNRLSSFDLENIELLNQVMEFYKSASEYNVQMFNRALNKYVSNLEWDNGFMVALIGLPFNDLDQLNYRQKSHLLGEIKALIDKYKSELNVGGMNEYIIE